MTKNFKKKRITLSLITLNLLLAFFLGVTLPYMESEYSFFMGILFIILLIIFNYIVLNQFSLLDIRNTSSTHLDNCKEVKKEIINRPVIEYAGKRYIFSKKSRLKFILGAPVICFLINFYFSLNINDWHYEIIVKHSLFLIDLFHDTEILASYDPHSIYPWIHEIPGRPDIVFNLLCTEIPAVSIYASILICTPHSKDLKTSKDIIWRKTKALIILSVAIYFINVVRIAFLDYYSSIGYDWDTIHEPVRYVETFYIVSGIILINKWVPEFSISIYYSIPLRKARRENLIQAIIN